MTRLSTFIAENTEEILAEWEVFARALPQGATMDVAELRDHAKAMLAAFQRDLDNPQSKHQQSEKSKGKSDSRAAISAAKQHGAERAVSGYSVMEMVAEFRALRASVIRLWSAAEQRFGQEDLEELTRFNEAIDQAIAESIERFTHEIEHSKEMFLAILGHDLRTPLGAVMMAAEFLIEVDDEKHRKKLTKQIGTSARRMNAMIGDLLDFTRGRLGDGIPIEPAEVDLATVCKTVVAEVCASYPKSKIRLETDGDLHGRWDGARISQALTNLLANAVQHGTPGSPVTVRAAGHADHVTLSVHSVGPTIPRTEIRRIFSAMTQAPTAGARDRRNLGLGLYIVERIVTAHGGDVTVRSSDKQGTTFTIELPRAEAKPRAARN